MALFRYESRSESVSLRFLNFVLAVAACSKSGSGYKPYTRNLSLRSRLSSARPRHMNHVNTHSLFPGCCALVYLQDTLQLSVCCSTVNTHLLETRKDVPTREWDALCWGSSADFLQLYSAMNGPTTQL
jgi:hypothetical protein